MLIPDTICLSEEAKRFNDKDLQVLDRLEQIMGSDSNTRREVYQQLINSKNSLPSEFEDILMKDLKQASNGISHHKVAVPSISGFLAQEVLNMGEVVHKLEEFQSNYHYKGIVILGIKNDDPNHVQRDLALFFSDPNILQMVRKHERIFLLFLMDTTQLLSLNTNIIIIILFLLFFPTFLDVFQIRS